MNDQELLKHIFADLDAAAKSLIKKRKAVSSSAAPRDACDACYKAYDTCYSGAGSDLEKAACSATLTKCVANNC